MIIHPTDAKAILYLSQKRTMYLGKLAPIVQQATAASTLIFSIDGTLEIIDDKNERKYQSRSFLIPAGAQVTINTNDTNVAMCFLDTLGTDLAILKSKMLKIIPMENNLFFYSGIPNEDIVINTARTLFEARAAADIAFKQLDNWIGNPPEGCVILADDRVTKTVELVKASILENRSVEIIAKELNLSVPRLSQLFKQITGVPIRRYRLWHRIFITAVKMAWGMSLTEAAVSSGFSDSAHFSRTFKEIGGVKPSIMLNAKNHTLIRILPPDNDMIRAEELAPSKAISLAG